MTIDISTNIARFDDQNSKSLDEIITKTAYFLVPIFFKYKTYTSSPVSFEIWKKELDIKSEDSIIYAVGKSHEGDYLNVRYFFPASLTDAIGLRSNLHTISRILIKQEVKFHESEELNKYIGEYSSVVARVNLKTGQMVDVDCKWVMNSVSGDVRLFFDSGLNETINNTFERTKTFPMFHQLFEGNRYLKLSIGQDEGGKSLIITDGLNQESLERVLIVDLNPFFERFQSEFVIVNIDSPSDENCKERIISLFKDILKPDQWAVPRNQFTSEITLAAIREKGWRYALILPEANLLPEWVIEYKNVSSLLRRWDPVRLW